VYVLAFSDSGDMLLYFFLLLYMPISKKREKLLLLWSVSRQMNSAWPQMASRTWRAVMLADLRHPNPELCVCSMIYYSVMSFSLARYM
jgi:hypothetical protein